MILRNWFGLNRIRIGCIGWINLLLWSSCIKGILILVEWLRLQPWRGRYVFCWASLFKKNSLFSRWWNLICFCRYWFLYFVIHYNSIIWKNDICLIFKYLLVYLSQQCIYLFYYFIKFVTFKRSKLLQSILLANLHLEVYWEDHKYNQKQKTFYENKAVKKYCFVLANVTIYVGDFSLFIKNIMSILKYWFTSEIVTMF